MSNFLLASAKLASREMDVHTELQGISAVDSCAHNAEVACSTRAPASQQPPSACWCGGRGVAAVTPNPIRWDVLCVNCKAKTPLLKSREAAFEFWNRMMAPL